MRRDTSHPNKIALLATGDEICNGDILNTNSQEIAQRLINQGMQPSMHMTAPDSTPQIEQALNFLLTSHRAIIITGGLGPTSDDLTRYALSNVLQRELVFDETTWKNITNRLTSLGYHTLPENNRQQALFPKDAVIIENPNGTAAGCMAQFGDQWIFMLPGPPFECLPLVENIVLPHLIQQGFQHTLYRKSWLLFGVSEGKIAEELDAAAEPFSCTTGYRIFYPYIEFKIHSSNKNDFEALVLNIEKIISPYLINDGQKTASTQLQQTLNTIDFTLQINDLATGGALESAIKTPENGQKIIFSNDSKFFPAVTIKGLDEFWQQKNNLHEASLELIFKTSENTRILKRNIPFRGKRVKLYAVEWISSEINQFINAIS